MTSTQLNSQYLGAFRTEFLRVSNAQVTVARIGEMQTSENLTITGNTIVGLDLPVVPTGAATKEYVDLAVGLAWKDPARYATTDGENLTFGTAPTDILPGTNATGNVDGVAIGNAQFTNGMKLLVKNQTNPIQNGLYTVVVDGLIKYLERSYDMLVGDTALGAIVYVVMGTVNSDTTWICNATVPCVVGTNALTFVRYSAVAAGSNTQIQVNLEGNLAAYSSFTYDNSLMTMTIGDEAANSYIKAPDATTTDADGGTLILSAGLADGAGDHGKVYITTRSAHAVFDGETSFIHLNSASASYQINGSIITANVGTQITATPGTDADVPTPGFSMTFNSSNGGDSTAAANNGANAGSIYIYSGDGGDGGSDAGVHGGTGGIVSITAGVGGDGNVGAVGGNVEIAAGNGGTGLVATGPSGGRVRIAAGNGGALDGPGGSLYLVAGAGQDTGADGKIFLNTSTVSYNIDGDTISSNDDVRITTAAGKIVTITAANATGTAAGGGVTITAGSGSTTGAGGSVTLMAGIKAGATADGDILLVQGGKYYKWPTAAPVAGGNKVLTWVDAQGNGAASNAYILSWA